MLIYGKNTATEAFKSGKQIDKIYLSENGLVEIYLSYKSNH